jgi:hypothetical protein
MPFVSDAQRKAVHAYYAEQGRKQRRYHRRLAKTVGVGTADLYGLSEVKYSREYPEWAGARSDRLPGGEFFTHGQTGEGRKIWVARRRQVPGYTAYAMRHEIGHHVWSQLSLKERQQVMKHFHHAPIKKKFLIYSTPRGIGHSEEFSYAFGVHRGRGGRARQGQPESQIRDERAMLAEALKLMRARQRRREQRRAVRK